MTLMSTLFTYILLIFALLVVTEQVCFQSDLNLTNVYCPKSDINGVLNNAVCCNSTIKNCTYSNAVAICKAKEWIILDSKYKVLSREKRLSNTGAVVATVGHAAGMATMMIAAFTGPAAPIVAVAGWLISGISLLIGALIPPPPPPNRHPVIRCFQLEPFKSDYGKTTKTLQWTIPKASDHEDGDISSKVQPRLTTKTYNKGISSESFTVRDSKGATNSQACIIDVKVTVPVCKPLSIHNGSIDPSIHYIYHGIEIKCSCDEGYILVGQPRLTCQTNGAYNYDVPKCNPIRCPESEEIKPKFGVANCDFSTLEFKTICKTDCSELDGYGLKDDVGYAQCQKDKTWSRSLPSCQDLKPPEFDYCPPRKEIIAPALKTSRSVIWNIPTATDNSGLKPVIKQTSGPVSGSVFDEGLTPISYTAIDAEGNQSPPCVFDILITVRRCSPPSLKGKFLKYTTLSDYLLGSEIQVSCDGGFQIEGATTLTCTQKESDDGYTMFWDLGNSSYPYCKQINCSQLQTPANGALVCDKWLFGTMCQIQCNTKYDIPLGPWATGQYVCSMSSGEWKPTRFVPGCTEKRNPNHMVMPGEIFYFIGNCSDEETLQMIKENFIKYMQGLQNSNFEGVCMNDDECSIENVDVRCGDFETHRKKRSRIAKATGSKATMNFNIYIKWQSDNNNKENEDRTRLLEMISNKIKHEVNSGAFNMSHFGVEINTQSLTFGVPSIKCSKGQLPKDNGLSCGTCPLGFELNDTTGECHECPTHFFRNESMVECGKCPEESFTRTTGAESISECKAMCSPGSFSFDGIEPCNKCNQNTYQQFSKSTNCTACPFGTTTYGTGSKSLFNCSGFDLKVDGSEGSVSFGKFSDNITSFSVAFWIKEERNDNKTADIILRETNNQLIVNLSSYFQLILHGENVETSKQIKNKKWEHLAITYDVVTSEINMYSAGTKVLTKKLSIGLPVFNSNSSLQFQNINDGGKVVLSNVIFSPLSIPDDSIRKLSSECSVDPEMSVLESFKDPMVWKRVNTEIVMPSDCDAFDDCISSPCEENSKCDNTPSGYFCTCLNGFTGQNCSIPPNHCTKNQCHNGATCINNLTGYTCDCKEGYKGNHCQIEIVNGQWSFWSGWSVCSSTCGGGVHQRKRYCDNPTPDPDGKMCLGDDTQNGTCSETACPECPDFPSVYGVLNECNKTDEMIVCTVSCRTGLAFLPHEPPLDLYECSPNTRYKWNSVPPSCTEFHSPRAIKTKTYVEYPYLSCSNKDSAKSQIIENSKSLQCLANKTCDVEVQIEGCSTSQDTVSASIELKSNLDDEDLDFEGFFNTNTPNDAMMSFFNSMNDLSLSTNKLNTSEEFYQINIDGMSYDADISSAETRVGVDCKEGHVQSTLFCADCPQGTYYFEKKCKPCDFGMFQDEIAQVKCKPCPEGYTTDYIGAKLKTECDVYVEQNLVKEEKHPQSLDNADRVWVPIVASVLSFMAAVAIAIATWYLVKKRYRICSKKTMKADIAKREMCTGQRENDSKQNVYQ